MEANYDTLKSVAGYEYEGTSIIVLKPLGELDHGGEQVIDEQSAEHAALLEMVARFKAPVTCENTPPPEVTYMDGVEVLSDRATFRRAILLLAGRSPTIQEDSFIKVGGEHALKYSLDQAMKEEPFYDWLKEVYNDMLLTDRYNRGTEAVDLLDMNVYPNALWFDMDDMEEMQGTPYSTYMIALGKEYANQAVAQDALELIAYVVRNDLPFSEILTADYMVVNPFSAVCFGVEHLVEFDNPLDPNEFRPAQVPGLPHAGVLTSPMYLNRLPTTETNRNRHRSRMTYRFFLATDVMKLAERPIDPTSIEDHNPTLFNPDCNVCHNVIDPLAGGFQNWTNEGQYLPPEEGWYADMLPPGFGEDEVPYELHYQSLPWMAQHMVEDLRFSIGAVHNMYRALTGNDPMYTPSDDTDPNYQLKMAAYEEQDKFFKALAQEFADSGMNLRTVIKGIILSPYFRAVNLKEDATEDAEIRMAQVGTGRLATPEQLDRRIVAVIGLPWRANLGSTNYLLSSDDYRIFYGGIDSDAVNNRITEPNGFITSVMNRMATEMSCMAVARDLAKAPFERKLFPYVEPSFMPLDVNGFEIPQVVSAIKQNIRYLYWSILGNDVAIDSENVTQIYELFVDVWTEGYQAIKDGQETATLHMACQATKDFWSDISLPMAEQITTDNYYTIRAWMAVTTVLLSDYEFLYQ
jgi:hypothetical protein